jgi:hypothetical protein
MTLKADVLPLHYTRKVFTDPSFAMYGDYYGE